MQAVVMLLFTLSGMHQNHTERHQRRSRYADEYKILPGPVLITGNHNSRRFLRRLGRDLYGLAFVVDILMLRNQVSLQVIKLLEDNKCLSLQAVGVQN